LDLPDIMKSNLLTAMAIGALATLSQPAFAVDGTITFTGAISANTCTINGNDTGNKDFTVLMPPVGVDALTTQGQTAGDTPFNILLTACTPDSGTVHVLFEPGASANAATGNLTAAAGSAANVEVRILNEDETPINVTLADGAQNSQSVALDSGTATLKYVAQYFALGQAGAGAVNASAKYTIIYQ